jgi:N-acetylmuramoyl-L-alanine amidase
MTGRGGTDGERVFVAAGHGGDDPGALADGIVERELNAAVATQLVRRLREHRLAVHTDLDHGNPGFPEEADLAREAGGVAYYVALHHNAAHPAARGAEAFGRGDPSRELAHALHDAQVEALRQIDPSLPDRGVKEATDNAAAKHLDRAPGVVAVLEPCFLTNAADAAICRDGRYVDLLAEALCRAIVDHGRVDGRWPRSYAATGVELPPLFSVVIPTHGRPGLLAEAVRSVLAQTVTSLEVLVVDDHGDPPVGPFEDPRVRVLRRDATGGPGAARNAGIDTASGRFLAFLDDDDLWTPNRLDLALAGLRRAPVAICRTRHLEQPEGRYRTLDGRVGDVLLDGTTPCLGATAVRRVSAPRFDERWLAIEDVEWWWRLATEQPVCTVPEVGYLVRLHDGPRGRNTVDQRVAENLAFLDEQAAFFGTHRKAAAHRWLRAGVLATQAGDHRTAVAAFTRVARLDPGPRALARVGRAWGRSVRQAASGRSVRS